MALTLLALICAAKAAAGEIEQVAVGEAHTCVRSSNGYVKCWGTNSYGSLGLGTTDHMGDGSSEMGDHLPAVALGTGRSAVDVVPGGWHTCARLDDGSVKCWGSNNQGQLGLGTTVQMGDGSNEMGDHLPAVALGTGRSAVEMAAGWGHNCARLDDGSVKCWGNNDNGQLGLGTTDDRGGGSSEMGDYLPAVALGTGRSAVEVAAGWYHICARLDDGTVKCWGRNTHGQLGLGTTDDRGDASSEMGDHLPAVALGTGRSAVEVAAGWGHTCARLDDGSVKCWGNNEYGQLGLGTTEHMGDGTSEMGDYLPAVALGAGRSAVEVAAGARHTCARLDDGSIKCWGRNAQGQLGLGNTDNMGDGSSEMGDHLPAVALGTGRSAVELAPSELHTCARLDDGSVKCWGYNYYGQLGLGTTDDRGDGSNEMGDHLPPVDIIMPTTTTTTSKTSTSSTTGTSSTSATGSTTTSSSTDSTTSTSTTSTSTSGSTSRTSSTSTTGTISTTTSSYTSTSTLTSTKSTLTITSSRSSSTTTTSTSTSASSVSQTSRTTTTRSVTTSTAATEEAREEQQRREDAKAAVNKIESETQVAVTDALTRLLGSLNGTGNASTGVLGEVPISTDAGDGKVVVYSPERLAESGEPATVSVDNSSATAEVPVGVLQQAQGLVGDGHLMLSVVVMNEELSEKFSTPPPATQEGLQEQQGPVTTLLSAPLVINIRDENGTVIDIGPLETPMTVQLEVKKRRLDQASKSARRKCAYWDEERAVWETNPTEIESIEDDEATPGLVRCRTRRMAIFSVVLEEFENTLKCSTLGQLLTADALASLSRTDWLLQMPTLVVMCFLFMSGLVLCYARCKDSQAEEELSREKRETMLEQGQDESTAAQTGCGRLAGKVRQLAQDCVGTMASVVKPERFINKCVREVLAYRTGLDSQSIRLIIPRDQIEDDGEEEPMHMVRSRGRLCTCPRRIQLRYRLSHLHTRMSHRLDLHQLLDINRTGKASVRMILHGSPLRRVIILFPAVHAYSVLFRLYAITPVAVRVSAIILKLLSAGFTNAIFFTTVTQQAVQGCNTDELSMEQGLARKFWVGLLSAVFGDLVLFVLLLIQKPSSKPNEAAKDKTTRLRRKRMLYWAASSCYGATCICYIMLFLANVQPKDATNWLQATGSSLVKDAVLMPTLTALALGSFTSLALCCRPELKESIQRQWLRGGETEEEARPVPLARGSELPRPSTQQKPRRGIMDTE